MTLHSVAKQLLNHHGMDIVEAKKQVDQVLADPAFRDCFEDIARRALLETLDDVWLEQRDAFRIAGGPTPSPHKTRIMDRAKAHVLMDWPLEPKTGLTLGRATKHELVLWCQSKQKRLATEWTELKWVRTVAAMLKKSTDTVKGHLTEDDLRGLFREAQKPASAA